MLLLAGSPLLTGSLGFAAIALTVLIVGLVLHRSRTVNILTPDEHYQRLEMRLRHPLKSKVTRLREWFG